MSSSVHHSALLLQRVQPVSVYGHSSQSSLANVLSKPPPQPKPPLPRPLRLPSISPWPAAPPCWSHAMAVRRCAWRAASRARRSLGSASPLLWSRKRCQSLSATNSHRHDRPWKQSYFLCCATYIDYLYHMDSYNLK